MKKILKFSVIASVIAASLMMATSCEEFLNQAPNSEQPKEYIFEDYLRANRYLDMLYYYMAPTWVGDGKFGGSYGFMESATDMADYTATYGVPNRSFNVGNWLYSSASDEVQIWYRCYNQIRRAWMFLENMDNFNNEPEGRKITMEGECHFMLAYYYFELLKRYGGVSLVTKVLDLESDYKIGRSSVDQIGQFIAEQLDLAQEMLPYKWEDENFGRADKVWCMAYRSRLKLYLASPLNNPDNDKTKWIEAAEAAKECIDYCEMSNQYSLMKDWQNIFMRYTPDEISELIVFKRIGGHNYTFNSKIIHYEQATPGDEFWGYASNAPSQNFVDRFPVIDFDAAGNAVSTSDFDWLNPDHVNNMYKNRDPRFYYTILHNGRYWIKREIGTWRDGTTYGPDRDPKNHLYSKTGYYLRKFWPRECKDKINPGSSKIYGFYFRLTEAYMNYAEAMNEAYGPDNNGGNGGMTAIEAVNKIRARLVCPANSKISDSQTDTYYYVKVERLENPDFPVLPEGLPGLPTGMTQDQAREKIRNERVIEFAFEDQYFYDILRWKTGVENIGGAIYGIDIIKTGSNYTYSKSKVEDRVFDANRMYHYPIPQDEVYNLGIDQNPGW